MDYYLLPPLLRWGDIFNHDEPLNLLDVDSTTDPTPVLCPDQIPKNEEAVNNETLDLEYGSVTIFSFENSDFQPLNSDPKHSDKANQDLSVSTSDFKKVRVNWPKPRLRNCILSQFIPSPDTDDTTVSCVWDSESEIKDVKTHIKLEHEKPDTQPEATIKTANSGLPVTPLIPEALTTPRSLQTRSFCCHQRHRADKVCHLYFRSLF